MSFSPSTSQPVDAVDAEHHESSIVSNAKKIFGSSALPTSFGKYDAFYTSLRDSEMEQRKKQSDSMELMRGYRGDGKVVGVRRRRKKNFRDDYWQRGDAPSGPSPPRSDGGDDDDSLVSFETDEDEAVGVDISMAKEFFSGEHASTEVCSPGAPFTMRTAPRDEPPSDKTDDGLSTSSNSSDASSILSIRETNAEQTIEGKDCENATFPGKQTENECILPTSDIAVKTADTLEAGVGGMETEEDGSLEWHVLRSDELYEKSATSFINEETAPKAGPTGLEDAFMEISLSSPGMSISVAPLEPDTSRTQTSPSEEAHQLPMPTPSPNRLQLENHNEFTDATDSVELGNEAMCNSPVPLDHIMEAKDPLVAQTTPSKLIEEKANPVAATPSPIMVQPCCHEEPIAIEEISREEVCASVRHVVEEAHQLSPIISQPLYLQEPTHAECSRDDNSESPFLVEELPTSPQTIPQPSLSKALTSDAEPIYETTPAHSKPIAASIDIITHRTPTKTNVPKAKPTPISSKRKVQKGMKQVSPPKRQKLDDVLKKLGIVPAKTWGTGVQLYNGRSIERISKMKRCKSKFCQWEPHIHSSRAACERCWTLASAKEREEFIANGRHLRIELVRGGCPSSCTLFAQKDGTSREDPIRLCRRCFGDMHHVGIRK